MKTLSSSTWILLVALFFGAAVQRLQAQYFLTPVNALLNSDAQIVLIDGSVVKGKVTSSTLGDKGLVSIGLKDEAGAKYKFKPEQVKSVRCSITKMMKLELFSDKTSNLGRLANPTFNELKERDYVEFEQVEWPDKPGKFLLSQLLNPGFDSKIKVYDYPGKKTGNVSVVGIPVKGNEARVFIVRKGDQILMVDKRRYEKEHFATLFADCPAVVSSLSSDEKGFNYFAAHTFTYENDCK